MRYLIYGYGPNELSYALSGLIKLTETEKNYHISLKPLTADQ